MPMDGLMLGFVARELEQKLAGGRVDKVQQPEKDEITLLIRSQGENHRLLLCASASRARLHLTVQQKTNPQEPPMFCMLLRKHLQGGRIAAVRSIHGDRIVEIDVEALDELGDLCIRTLVLEVMGRHSNLILKDNQGKITDALHHVTHVQSRVRQVLPGLPYLPAPAQDKLDPLKATLPSLTALLSQPGAPLFRLLQEGLYGFSPQSAKDLATRLRGDEWAEVPMDAVVETAERLLLFLQSLPELFPPVWVLGGEGEVIDVYPFPQVRFAPEQQQEVLAGVSAALDGFFSSRDNRDRLAQKAASLEKTLRQNIEKQEKKLNTQAQALDNEAETEQLRIWAELLTANLYRVEKGMPQATLENYYDPENRLINIPLDIRFTPAQNAQRYFKQVQKAHARRRMAVEQIEKIRQELDFLEEQLDDVRKCTEESELEEIRSLLTDRGYLRASHNRNRQRKLAPSKPYHYVSSNGQSIFVGKNSKQNEQMTSAAPGDATWLHAKEMPGSHVLVPDGQVSEATLLEAAVLAAYYSKGGNSAQVPVDYTLRKYVKKPGGSPPGFVIYTHQKTLYVTPEEAKVKGLRQMEA